MKDFKIIATEERPFFEKKLREYLDQGYEVKHTNLSIAIDLRQRFSNMTADKTITGFYAYLEKEI